MSAAIEIERLAELHRTGALTDEEFARAKARVLDAGAAANVTAQDGTTALGLAVDKQLHAVIDRLVG